MTRKFNYPIHAFRGFAIINIVAIHAFSFILFYAGTTDSQAGWSLAVLGMLNGVLLHDATLYFTYISGILFSMVLAERGYKRFFRSKFLFVFLPYLFFTTLYSLRVTSGPPDWTSSLFDGNLIEFLQVVAGNLLTGNAILIFWYIPVLLVLYALTPLLARLIASPGKTWLKALIIGAPLIASRVWPDVSWTNYVYFLGAYLIGIMVGTHYEETISLVRQNSTLLIVVAIVTSIMIGVVGYLEIPTIGITNLAETAWYVQKIAIAGLVLLWFEHAMTRVPKWLDLLGNYAFAIFFIHMAFAIQLVGWMTANDIRLDTGWAVLAYMVIAFGLALGGSVLVTFLGKLLLRRYSRFVLGA